MTISSETRKAGPFVGNGITTAFPFAFKVFSTSDVYVVRADSAGVETALSLGSNYTVALNANQNANPGGTVTLAAALATGQKLVVTSEIPHLQPTDLTNQGGFYPSVINAALDRLTILVQQLREKIDRSAKLPITSAEDADALVADIVLLAENFGQIAAVAGSIADVQAVAADGVDIGAVASSLSDVVAVASNLANVNTVAAADADINTVVANLAAIVNAASEASNAAASAAAALAAAVSAANSFDAFDDRYLGSKTGDPTTDNDGEVLLTGALYFNSVSGVMRVWDGDEWLAAYVPVAGYVAKTGDTMTGPLVVPANASGTQVPRAQEVVLLAGNQTVAGVKTFSAAPVLSAGVKLAAATAWEIVQSGTDLIFKYNGTNRFKLTSAGALIVSSDVTGGGAP